MSKSKFETYYLAIREQRKALALQFPDDSCLVVSAGNVCEVTLDIAARLLTEGTHALASEAEACAFRATQEMNRVRSPLVGSLENARAQFAALMAGKDRSK
jgi:roadblock/LC7 domain-containing protein